MKIKLIAPARKPEWGEDFWDIATAVRLRGRKTGGPYLSLYILAALTPNDIEVIIEDERTTPINFDEKVDLVGITVVTSLAYRAYEISDAYRKRGVPVVMGGIHVSILPEEAIQHCDSVVIGEAEEIWGQVVRDAQTKNLQKFYRASRFPDLSITPLPKWELMKANDYSYLTVQTGRGCPYDCEFCLVKMFNGNAYRHRKIESVVNEIGLLNKIAPHRLIFFVDDNLLAVPSYAKELFQCIESYKIRWWCQSSINNLKDDRMLELMYKSGCRMIFVGIESVKQDSLDTMNKSRVNKVEEYREIIDKVHSKGISIFGSFVLGNDTEDKSIFQKTASFIMNSNIAYSMINILTPPPGSDLFKRLEAEGRILHRNWGYYNTDSVCFRPLLMSPEELKIGRDWVLHEIYSYDALHKRLIDLWKNGVLAKKRKNFLQLFTLGRIIFTIKCIFTSDLKRTMFVLKSLWNVHVGSVASISLALSFHDYAYRFSRVNNLVKNK